jgi:membrane protease YdiL (CAAX protease family)
MSHGGSLVLVIFGALIAFWAGGKWRHYWRTVSDHGKARELAANLGEQRWGAGVIAFVAVGVMVLFLLAVSSGLRKVDGVPAQTPSQPSIGRSQTPSQPSGGRSQTPSLRLSARSR